MMMSSSVQTDQVPRLAFLGPFGTFSHQAAYDGFGEHVQYVEKKTITDAFNALSPFSPLAVIPQENSIFGTVVETYDLLRSPDMGINKFVRGEIVLEVQHCLIVRRGVELSNITKVLSHEQALGQCSRYVEKHLPHASLVKTASTAEAAKCLLSPEYNSAECAAICSRVCVELFDGLEILTEGIQNSKSNFTRFYILSTEREAPLPHSVERHQRTALIKLSHNLPPLVGPRNIDVTSLISAMALPAARIDRRPSPGEIPLQDIYFVEVYRKGTGEGAQITDNLDAWMKEVEGASRRVEKTGGYAVTIGVW